MKNFLILLFIFVFLAGCTVNPKAPDTTPLPSDEWQKDELPNNSPPIEEPSQEEEEIDEESEEEKLLHSMTVQEKIGQLLMVGFQPNTPKEQLAELIQKYKVGGFIFFARNYESFDDLYHLTKELNELNRDNKVPLFLSVDAEGGTVHHIPKGATRIPDARTLGKTGDPALTEKAGEVIGRELAAGGINMDMAPVLDIVVDPNNKLMLRRAYGDDPQTVREHGLAFAKGLKSQHVIAVAKHFPGHGDTSVDSHKGLPIIDIPPELWWNREVLPFQAAIRESVDAIMVGHISFPQLDPTGLPASQSKVFLQDILRKQLGFEGLLITDDIEMEGFAQDQGIAKAALASFQAGVDVLLVCHTYEVQLEVLRILTESVESGEILEERLNESVLRILKLKSGLKDFPSYPLKEAREIYGNPDHREAFEGIK